MIGTRRVLIPGSSDAYMRKVLATNPIAYWPLSERAGSVAYDVSGHGLHGTYSGVGLGYPGIGDGLSMAYFSGASYVNTLSAALAAAFSGTEGTLLTWARVASAAVWTDGASRAVGIIQVDANNYMYIRRTATNNILEYRYRAGGTTLAPTTTGAGGFTGSFCVAQSWSNSAEEFIGYLNGSPIAAASTPLPNWVGVPTTAEIGDINISSGSPWLGYLGHYALWDRALTPAEHAALGVIR